MLGRIIKGLVWAAVIFRNPVAAETIVVQRAVVALPPLFPEFQLDASVINQTPLTLANAMLAPRVAPAVILQRSSMLSNSYWPNRSAQPDVGGLADYLEYFLGLALGVPAAVAGYLMGKKSSSTTRHPPRVVVTEKQAPPVKRATLAAPAVAGVLPASRHEPFIPGTPPKNHVVFPKTQIRKTKTSDIRARLEARRQAARQEIKSNQAVTPAPRIKRVIPRCTPAESKSVTPSTVVPAPDTAPKREPLALCLKRVKVGAVGMARFVARFSEDGEVKLDNDALRVRDLLALYHLHRYNVFVLQLMANYPFFRGRNYTALILPLRTELAHHSSECSSTVVMATLERLRVALDNFLGVSARADRACVSDFIRNMSMLLEDSELMQQRAQRRAVTLTGARAKGKNVAAAYADFVNQSIPEMQRYALKLQSFENLSVGEAEQGRK